MESSARHVSVSSRSVSSWFSHPLPALSTLVLFLVWLDIASTRRPHYWEVSQASFRSTSSIFLRNGFPKNDQMADSKEGTAPNNVRVYILHDIISFRAWLAPRWKNILGLQLYWHFSFPELSLEWGLELLLVSGLNWCHSLRPDSFNCSSLKILSTEDVGPY